MSDQLDKKLINRINDVFDNFEDDSANENWDALRKRFPEKKKKRTAVWWYSSAAAILLLGSIWLAVDNTLTTTDQKSIGKAQTEQPDIERKKVAGQATLQLSENKDTRVNRSRTTEKSTIVKDDLKVTDNTTIVKNKLSKRQVQASNREPVTILSFKSDEASNDLLSDKKNSANEEKPKADFTIIALAPNSSKSEDSNLMLQGTHSDSTNSNKEIQTARNKEIFPTEIRGEQVEKLGQVDARKEITKSKRAISISFFAGSYFNYAEGSESSVNSGVGFTSDIKLSKRLKLSTGISLGTNSLKYEEVIPQQAASSFASLHKNSFNPNSFDSPVEGKAAMFTTPIRYSLNSYDAKLTGLDIPINLKYTLLDTKNTIYLSSGISSNFFINESYTYSFDYQINGNTSSKAPNEESSIDFQSFDFARVLNFSFGFEHALNKQTIISFEPFIKYPLSGLGAQNLKFSAAGINLKFNFKRLK